MEVASCTNMAGIAASSVSVTANSDPVEVGRRVLDQLRSDLDDGSIHQRILRLDERQTGSSALVTNVGALSDFPTPSGLVVTDFGACLAMDPVAVAQLMAMAAAAQMAAGAQEDGAQVSGWPGGTFLVFTYAGRLGIEMETPVASVSAEQAQALLGRIEAQLAAIAKRSEA
ncbi:MAG TPA: hypothetical protein VM925_16645 [Labilithrix sp.]|nr:hypothetical protein [Labilithrix sp.]